MNEFFVMHKLNSVDHVNSQHAHGLYREFLLAEKEHVVK
jgi:hypothetical protein